MNQRQHLAFIEAAQCHTEKIADANADRHPHAADRPTQHDTFAMEFDLSQPTIGTHILRIETDR